MQKSMELYFVSKEHYLLVQSHELFNLDHRVARAFISQIKQHYSPGQSIIIDGEKMEYLDSAGISALIHLRKLALSHAGHLKLAALNSFVLELLRISKLHRVFEVYETVGETILSLEAGKAGKKTHGPMDILLEIHSPGKIAVVKLLSPEVLLQANYESFLREIKDLLHKHRVIYLDIDVLRNLDSFGMSALLLLHRMAQKQGKRIIYVYENKTLKRLLRLFALNNILEHFDNLETALRHSGGAPDLNLFQILAKKGASQNIPLRLQAEPYFVDLNFLRTEK
ncbi:MAG: STAS domain-containing protein [Calditrichaeota bacterium]|nr:MAG: STAS domain-containing protein [Calditrichota bacterium]